MKSRIYILDENGEPLACEDLMEWARWFETADRQVALTNIPNREDPLDADYKVSTVFLGLDHNHFKGPPVIWETMVFKGGEGLWYDRCGGSREQAEAMHNNMCRMVANKAREQLLKDSAV